MKNEQLKRQILQLLELHSNVKARKLTTILENNSGIDIVNADVNSELYKLKSKGIVTKNKNHEWKLINSETKPQRVNSTVSSTKSKNYGSERAKKHIAEAKELSAELGGTDKDVKKWFFSLKESEMEKVWSLYSTAYGDKKLDYAKEAFPKWKSGKRIMSGLIASRLFKILPPIMPISTKYDLVESLWNHVGPKKKRLILSGSQASSEEIVSIFREEVGNLTTKWEIPAGMSIRFNWLSENNSKVTQELLSHIRKQEKELGERVIEQYVPILKEKFSGELKETTTRLSHIIQVGNQSVELRLQGEGAEIKVSEWYSASFRSSGSSGSGGSSASSGTPPWIWLMGFFIVVIVILSQK
jgi:hypothetical protein